MGDALPWTHIDEQLAAGRKLVFVSLGTMGTSPRFWGVPFGNMGRDNGLAEFTGKDICQHLWRTCAEAFGGDDSLLVVMSLGSMPDAWEGLPAVPHNFILRTAVPQVELLPR